jgi:hypothetical protein
MNVNLIAVIAATIAQFVIGAVWYMLVFGKLWGQIHGFDKLSPEVQKEMASKMGPFYGLQILVSILTAFVLAWVIAALPDKSPYLLAFLMWLGFVVPTQFSAVVFGGTEPQWMVKKLLVMTSGTLACLLASAAVISLF